MPLILAGALLLAFPSTRRIRALPLVLYLGFMVLIIEGALHLVAWIARAVVPQGEVLVVLWFMIGWRIAWELWSRMVGRAGQRWVKDHHPDSLVGTFGLHRLIPAGRITATSLIFAPAFLASVLSHRCKLLDGQDPLHTLAVAYEAVRIPTSDGLTLDGWFIPERNASRTIVICHGAGANKGNFIWFYPALSQGHCNVLFFDFRAHGASGGRVTTWGVRERLDVLAAVDWLKRKRPEQARTIIGLGSSLGALALALAAAEEPRIDAIVLDSPFISPRRLLHDRASLFPIIGPALVDYLLWVMSIESNTNMLNVSAVDAVSRMGPRPLFVVHGSEDVMMPPEHAQALFDAAEGPKAIWFGPGPHSNIITTDPDEYAERLFSFLREHLKDEP